MIDVPPWVLWITWIVWGVVLPVLLLILSALRHRRSGNAIIHEGQLGDSAKHSVDAYMRTRLAGTIGVLMPIVTLSSGLLGYSLASADDATLTATLTDKANDLGNAWDKKLSRVAGQAQEAATKARIQASGAEGDRKLLSQAVVELQGVRTQLEDARMRALSSVRDLETKLQKATLLEAGKAEELALLVSDSAEFRSALKAQVTGQANVPIGTILAFYGSTADLEEANNWLLCDGRKLSKVGAYPTLEGILARTATPGYLPNLQGQFLRGLDPDRKTDIEGGSRIIGSHQSSAVAGHTHELAISLAGNHTHADTEPSASPSGNMQHTSGRGYAVAEGATSPGGSHRHTGTAKMQTKRRDNRPTNIAVNWLIKARDPEVK